MKKPLPASKMQATKIPSIRTGKKTVSRHKCTAERWLQSEGYGHSVKDCFEDTKGFLWLSSDSGRKITMVGYCPFCGFQALRAPEKLKISKLVPKSEILLPPDRPDAVWRRFSVPFIQEHLLFGLVRVKASDGVHSKVILQDDSIVTVHNNNLSKPIGIPLAPKVEKAKKETEASIKRAQKEADTLAKYMSL